MSTLRIGAAFVLLLAVSACGGDDDAADTSTTSSTPAAVTTAETTEPTTAPTTTAPSTTEPAATTTAPATTTTPNRAADHRADSVDHDRATTTTEPTPTTEPTMVDVKVYFFRGERLEIAHRQVEAPAVLRGAIAAVLAGPTAAEQGAGLTSEIPPATTLRDVSLADDQAIVDLSSDYESGGGSMSMVGRLGQVIFTATQFDNVDRVLFWLDGEPVEFFGGEGIVLDEPQARVDVPRQFTGGIIIDAPEPGATVRSPFTVTGEGDLFEGYAAMWVWRDGKSIAGPFGVTAGAWGMWDEFETTVTLDITPGPITLIVDDGNGCTPGDPECGEPNPAIAEVTLAG